MKPCKHWVETLFAEYGMLSCCNLRNKPTECQGDRTQCWYPELLNKEEKPDDKNKT